MTNNKKPGYSIFHAQDQYVNDLLKAQEQELQELKKEPEDQTDHPDYVQRARMATEDLSFKEKLQLVSGAVAAGLVVAGVFILAFFFLILFCTQVWFA